MAGAIFVAAVLAWKNADAGQTLIASLLITVALAFTAGSALYTIVYKSPLRTAFLYSQTLFDLVVVTAIVHVTGGASSQCAALYVLVTAAASLLLPVSGGLLIAALGCILYSADVILTPGMQVDLGVWLQLGVFAAVALGSGYIAARLRQAGAGTEQLAAELVKVRLQAADILRNIRSGIVTVDAAGGLVYANPAASHLLGMPLDDHVGARVIETISQAAPELARALERAAQDGTRTYRAEGSITVRDRRFPIGLNTTSSEGDGGRTEATATAIFQDISDQKRLDSLHARTERLEAVAELSASLAHEIKNPLAAVRSAVEQLAGSPRATPDEQTLGTLIVRESDRLSRLLSEFLDFARVRVARAEPGVWRPRIPTDRMTWKSSATERTRGWSSTAMRTCCIAPCSTSRSTRCRRRPRAAACAWSSPRSRSMKCRPVSRSTWEAWRCVSLMKAPASRTRFATACSTLSSRRSPAVLASGSASSTAPSKP